MAVQYGIGDVIIDDDDLMINHNGKQLAVKIRAFGPEQEYIVGCRLNGNTWETVATLYEFDSLITVESAITNYGSAEYFVEQKIVPPINHWLALEFNTMPNDTNLEAINKAIAKLIVEVINNIPQVKV